MEIQLPEGLEESREILEKEKQRADLAEAEIARLQKELERYRKDAP